MMIFLKWYKRHVFWLRDAAVERGLNPFEVVPPVRFVTYFRTADMAGCCEIERAGLPKRPIKTAAELRGVVGQQSIDLFVSGAVAETWVEPLKPREERQARSDQGNSTGNTSGVAAFEAEEERAAAGDRSEPLASPLSLGGGDFVPRSASRSRKFVANNN